MIDAARIREVLKQALATRATEYAELAYPGWFDRARALLRDIDAQGLAPAGWRNSDVERLARMLRPSWFEFVHINEATGQESHGLTLQKKGARATDAAFRSGMLYGLGRADVALRALTSGAEAASDQAERLLFAAHGDPARVFETTEELMNYLDESDSDRGASAERPLSEWSDDEDKRKIEAYRKEAAGLPEDELWRQTRLLGWGCYAGSELRQRGWRPHYGSDKAPVEGEVEVPVWFRGGWAGRATGRVQQWNHARTSRDPNQDIIAFRPVLAKAEPAADDKLVDAMRTVSAFNEPAADADEVERLPTGPDIASAIEKCDWSGVPIGNKAILLAALADGIELCFAANSHVTLDDDEWMMVCAALRSAALRPAPSEEQVERAVNMAKQAWRDTMAKATSPNTSFFNPTPMSEETVDRAWRSVARAILASAEAQPRERAARQPAQEGEGR